MATKKNKSDLISEILKENRKSGKTPELSNPENKKSELSFTNLDHLLNSGL